MSEPKYENARRAVEIMAAWFEAEQNPEFMHQRLLMIVEEDGAEGLVNTIHGFVTLAGLALVKAGAATGTDERAVLQDIAMMLGAH